MTPHSGVLYNRKTAPTIRLIPESCFIGLPDVLLPELRKKADIIILWAFANEAVLASLSREFYEVDLILGGKVSQSSHSNRIGFPVSARRPATSGASCLECDVDAGKSWQDSNHAHAFTTLVRKNADADPNCISCHTVGFGSPSGYRREFAATRLTHVL